VAGLLEGVRVLDLSAVIAGPLCSYQLAMLGAEIIKVEPPKGGDLARRLGSDPELNGRLMGVSFLANNSGKKSITLDLKQPKALEVLKALAATSDVLLENFRPGAMKRLKFDYEVAKIVKPDLIWCSITGFGQTGPMAQRQAYDQIVQGYCGVMSLTGTQETAPNRVGYQVCDTTAAITGAMAICAALYRKKVSGEGEFIDLSMLDASLASMPSWPISNLLNAGKVPTPMGNDNGASSPSGAFRTGHGLINIVANDQKQYESLCDAIDGPELKTHPHFIDRPLRVVHREELRAGLEKKLAVKSAMEWDAILAAANVPAGPILELGEVLDLPQTAHREIIKTFDDTAIGRPFSIHRLGFTLGSALPDVDLPPPHLGEHTDDVLASLDYSPEAIAELRALGAI
jgi:CoA:oxalate CoA-transferase